MFTDPTREQIQRLAKSTVPDGVPLTLLHLLRFREEAAYPEDSPHAPCSGREAYMRYASTALVFLQEMGAKIQAFQTLDTFVGPGEEQWDQALVVEYPSHEALIGLLHNPEYIKTTVHRTAALLDTRAIPMMAR